MTERDSVLGVATWVLENIDVVLAVPAIVPLSVVLLHFAFGNRSSLKQDAYIGATLGVAIAYALPMILIAAEPVSAIAIFMPQAIVLAALGLRQLLYRNKSTSVKPHVLWLTLGIGMMGHLWTRFALAKF